MFDRGKTEAESPKIRFLQVFREFGGEGECEQQGYRKDEGGIHDGGPTGVGEVYIGCGIGSALCLCAQMHTFQSFGDPITTCRFYGIHRLE